MPKKPHIPMKGEVASFGDQFVVIPGMAHASRGPYICFHCRYAFQKNRNQALKGKCRRFAEFMDLPIKNIPEISMNNASCKYFEERDV